MSENIPFTKQPVSTKKGTNETEPGKSLLTASKPIPIQKPQKFPFDVVYETRDAIPPVYVAGDFNNWQRELASSIMGEDEQGRALWKFNLPIEATVGRHRYKLFVGHFDTGAWVLDSTKEIEYDCAGNANNVFLINRKETSISPLLPSKEGFDRNLESSDFKPGAPPGWKPHREYSMSN